MSAPTAADEKAAMAWLNRTGPCANWQPFTPDSDKPRATLRAMLQRPVMPEEPSEEAVDAMIHRGGWENRPDVRASFRESYRALEAHLAKPQEPKTKERWAVGAGFGFVHFDSFPEAMQAAEAEAKAGHRVTVERKTTAALQHIGVTPKTVFYVSWTTENGSSTAGPFDGPDDASREAQNLLRADFRRVVSITPHQVSA